MGGKVEKSIIWFPEIRILSHMSLAAKSGKSSLKFGQKAQILRPTIKGDGGGNPVSVGK